MELNVDNEYKTRGAKGVNKKAQLAFTCKTPDGINATLHFTGPMEVMATRFGSWAIDVDNPLKVTVLLVDNVVTSSQAIANILAGETSNDETPGEEAPGDEDTRDTSPLEGLSKEIKQAL